MPLASSSPRSPPAGGHGDHDGHAHGAGGHTHVEQRGARTDERVERLAHEMCDGAATEANLRGILDLAKEHGVPADKLVVFIFESLLNERAATQIRECAPLLRGLFAASADKRRTQRAVLQGEPRHAAFSSLTWVAAPPNRLSAIDTPPRPTHCVQA